VRLVELRKFCSSVFLLQSISSKLCPRSPWHISAVFVRLFQKFAYNGQSWWNATLKFLSAVIASCAARTTYRERERERERERDRQTDRQTDGRRDRKREIDGAMLYVLPLLVDRTSVFRLSPVRFLTDLPTSSQALVRLLSTDYFGSIMNQNGSQSPHLSADSR